MQDGTFKLLKNELKKVTYKNGYQVGIKELFLLDNKIDNEQVKNAFKMTTKNKKHCLGIWKNPENGKIYVDISINIKSKKQTIDIAKKYNQLSIYDWKNDSCLTINC